MPLCVHSRCATNLEHGRFDDEKEEDVVQEEGFTADEACGSGSDDCCTSCATGLSSRSLVAHSPPSSSPSITRVNMRVPSITGTGTMRRGINPAVLSSVREPHTSEYFAVHRSRWPRTVHDIGEGNAESWGSALDVSSSR